MARELITTGNELAAKAAIDSKCEFFGGYPITPSSEIMHVLSSALHMNQTLNKKVHYYFQKDFLIFLHNI